MWKKTKTEKQQANKREEKRLEKPFSELCVCLPIYDQMDQKNIHHQLQQWLSMQLFQSTATTSAVVASAKQDKDREWKLTQGSAHRIAMLETSSWSRINSGQARTVKIQDSLLGSWAFVQQQYQPSHAGGGLLCSEFNSPALSSSSAALSLASFASSSSRAHQQTTSGPIEFAIQWCHSRALTVLSIVTDAALRIKTAAHVTTTSSTPTTTKTWFKSIVSSTEKSTTKMAGTRPAKKKQKQHQSVSFSHTADASGNRAVMMMDDGDDDEEDDRGVCQKKTDMQTDDLKQSPIHYSEESMSLLIKKLKTFDLLVLQDMDLCSEFEHEFWAPILADESLLASSSRLGKPRILVSTSSTQWGLMPWPCFARALASKWSACPTMKHLQQSMVELHSISTSNMACPLVLDWISPSSSSSSSSFSSSMPTAPWTQSLAMHANDASALRGQIHCMHDLARHLECSQTGDWISLLKNVRLSHRQARDGEEDTPTPFAAEKETFLATAFTVLRTTTTSSSRSLSRVNAAIQRNDWIYISNAISIPMDLPTMNHISGNHGTSKNAKQGLYENGEINNCNPTFVIPRGTMGQVIGFCQCETIDCCCSSSASVTVATPTTPSLPFLLLLLRPLLQSHSRILHHHRQYHHHHRLH
jgi:hypothetical protein